MRFSTYLFATLLFAWVVSCGAQPGFEAPQPRAGAAYDPQAPLVVFPPLESALESVTWKDIGFGRSITSLDEENELDLATLDALRVRSSASGVSFGLRRPQAHAYVYLRFNHSSEHIVEANTSVQPRSIGLLASLRPGLISLGVCATNNRKLGAAAGIAEIRFAPGADTSRVAAAVNNATRSKVDSLVAVDNTDSSATLNWLERHTGDYDVNGEVNIADLTPIGLHFMESYVDSSSPDYAELEVVDGDDNTEINIADLTPIGANFSTSITGYNVYRTPLSSFQEEPDVNESARWTKVENISDPNGPSAPRQNNSQKTRLPYTFRDDCGDGNFAWYVVAVGLPADNPLESTQKSDPAKVTVTPGGPPPSGLTFEIMAPDSELANVNGEFYLAVKVNEISGLFSANVRFEYDSSLVQLVESVPAYDSNVNFLDPPLFIAVDDVLSTTDPYVQLGFNATQKQGTAAKDGSGYLGFFKFKCIAAGINDSCFRFPQSSNFIYLWGDAYGVATATPALGSPQLMNIAN